LRNKLATQVVIRATESFNLHCNNVARQVEEKCCPYYRTFKVGNTSVNIFNVSKATGLSVAHTAMCYPRELTHFILTCLRTYLLTSLETTLFS